MLSMVSGSVGLRAQPARRAHLLLRAGAAAGGDDRRQLRGALGRAVRPDDLRVRRVLLVSASCSRSPAGPPSSRCKYGMRGVMAVAAPPSARARRRGRRARRHVVRTWRWSTGSAFALCWAAGHRAVPDRRRDRHLHARQGLQYLSPSLLVQPPAAAASTSAKSGGFLDPIVGHAHADRRSGSRSRRRSASAIAVWLSSTGGPRWLARAVESGIEIVAGTPSIVLAIFGLAALPAGFFGFLSFTAQGGAVFGRSFLTAGAMMALIALPLVVGATREALQAIPRHVREASYALGKTRRDDPPRPAAVVAPGIATGAALGMGRIVGDTAIVIDPARRHAAARARGRRPRRRTAARHRLHADELRLQQLARRARATRRRRPTPRRSSCC